MPARTRGSQRFGGLNVSLATVVAQMGILDRPVLDQTGLTGTFDFSLEYVPNGLSPDSTLDSGPTYFEALKEQLGLMLVPQTGPVDVLFIDHVEEPSPN